MRIEVLYVPGCPNFQPALERVNTVLALESVQADVRTIAIGSHEQASAMRFPGSPTIRVDGNDVDPDQISAPGLTCRLYGNHSGIPSEDSVRLAVSRARHEE